MNKCYRILIRASQKAFRFLPVLALPLSLKAQKADSTQTPGRFGGAITLTNKGVSFIPTFTLGKPAVIFDMAVGKKLTFEPQFRFSTEGKPWSFIFWLRYKLLNANKFYLTIGAHPSVVFKTVQVIENGVSKEIISGQRYLAGEISPNYRLSNQVTVGVYYLTSFGLTETPIKHTHFITVNSTISHIALTKDLAFRFSPLVYYLKMDHTDGIYYSASVALSAKRCPISVQYMFNNPVHSTITGGQDFISNLSLIYSFSKNYVPVK